MRKPLDNRVIAFCNPRLVPTRLVWALFAAMLETTEKDAIAAFLLETAAGVLAGPGRPGEGAKIRRGNRNQCARLEGPTPGLTPRQGWQVSGSVPTERRWGWQIW